MPSTARPRALPPNPSQSYLQKPANTEMRKYVATHPRSCQPCLSLLKCCAYPPYRSGTPCGRFASCLELTKRLSRSCGMLPAFLTPNKNPEHCPGSYRSVQGTFNCSDTTFPPGTRRRTRGKTLDIQVTTFLSILLER